LHVGYFFAGSGLAAAEAAGAGGAGGVRSIDTTLTDGLNFGSRKAIWPWRE
jgi:hypothetical protein